MCWSRLVVDGNVFPLTTPTEETVSLDMNEQTGNIIEKLGYTIRR